MTKEIDIGLIKSCQNLSEGGLVVAAAEVYFDGFRLELDLNKVDCSEKLNNFQILFSESNTRFLAEVEPQNADCFEKILGKFSGRIGIVTEKENLIFIGLNKEK